MIYIGHGVHFHADKTFNEVVDSLEDFDVFCIETSANKFIVYLYDTVQSSDNDMVIMGNEFLGYDEEVDELLAEILSQFAVTRYQVGIITYIGIE